MDFLPNVLGIREQPRRVVGGGEGAARFVALMWRNVR